MINYFVLDILSAKHYCDSSKVRNNDYTSVFCDDFICISPLNFLLYKCGNYLEICSGDRGDWNHHVFNFRVLMIFLYGETSTYSHYDRVCVLWCEHFIVLIGLFHFASSSIL